MMGRKPNGSIDELTVSIPEHGTHKGVTKKKRQDLTRTVEFTPFCALLGNGVAEGSARSIRRLP